MIFNLGSRDPDASYGLIIDIGSASVAASMVVSETLAETPAVVWSHVEKCPIGEATTTGGSHLKKHIATALTTTALEAGNAGLRALSEHHRGATITHVTVTIAAPWSYTVPKRVTYHAKEPIAVDQALVNELVASAEEQTKEQYKNNDIFSDLAVDVLTSEASHFFANGYKVDTLIGQQVQEIALIRDITVASSNLMTAIKDIHESIAPNAKLTITSFMQQMRHELLQTASKTTNYGLIDISGETAEVGVVHNNQLQVVINTRQGINHLVRSLAEISQQPTASAHAQLLQKSTGDVVGLSASQTEVWQEVYKEFIAALATAIKRAGALSEIPEHFIAHGTTQNRSLVINVVKQALSTLPSNPSVSLASEVLPEIQTLKEPRLALSVAVFHNTVADFAH